MRKVFWILYSSMIVFFAVTVNAEFTLPSSLTTIEDEAFFGTVADSVIMQEKVAFIGERSFAEMSSLRRVEIPSSVDFIADSAFEASKKVVFWGVSGYYAESWAKSHGICFFDITVLVTTDHSSGLNRSMGTLLSVFSLMIPYFTSKSSIAECLKIRVRRRYAELYPILYDFP